MSETTQYCDDDKTDTQRRLTVQTHDGQVEIHPEQSAKIMAFEPSDAVRLGWRLIELAEEADG